MRMPYSSVTPAVVESEARAALAAVLPWQPFGRSVTVDLLLDVLVLLAATGRSLFGVACRFAFGCSYETLRQALQANVSSQDTVVHGLNQALFSTFRLSRRDQRRQWLVAIDTHYQPFYGDRTTPGIIGGQKKQGTKYFYAYATAVLLHKRRRYTVALMPFVKGDKPHLVVQTLLRRVLAAGLKIKGVALDSAFGSGDTLLYLKKLHVAYVVPLRRHGKGSNNRNQCFELPLGTVTRTQWTTEDSRKKVSTDIYVCKPSEQPKVMVYAFGGWGRRRARASLQQARLARRRYRERFGIETSYRQKNQAHGHTTKKDSTYRLLLFGIALLLRQVWVWLTFLLARSQRLRPTAKVLDLPFPRLLDWLAQRLEDRYPEPKSISLNDIQL